MTQDLIYKERGAISPFILVTQFTLCHDLVITLPVPLWTLTRRPQLHVSSFCGYWIQTERTASLRWRRTSAGSSLYSSGFLLCCLPPCWCLPGTKRLPSITHAVGWRQYFIHVKGETEGWGCSSVIEDLSSMHQQEVQSPAPHLIPKREMSENQ